MGKEAVWRELTCLTTKMAKGKWNKRADLVKLYRMLFEDEVRPKRNS